MEIFDRKYKRVGAALDGEQPMTPDLEAVLREDAELRRYAEAIAQVRGGAESLRAAPRIEDAQFQRFFAGIQDGIAEAAPAPARAGHGRGWLAAFSLVAAALVVAVSAFIILDGGPQAVQANVVESVSTDLEGARFDVYDSDEGVTTIWMVSAGDDL